jgi:hypothetical protein
MLPKLRIGIDFDNTIIAYDEVFCARAKIHGLLDPSFSGRKQAVRDAIRLLPEGEISWQRLQGEVYGKGIADATIVGGFPAFLRRCRRERSTVVVVSHKTEYGHFDSERTNLRQAALDWMAAHGLLGTDWGIGVDNVHFEDTRAEKLRRIDALGLTHFIDDLEEVLVDRRFPANVDRILFAEHAQRGPYTICPTWQRIEEHVFGTT